MPCKSIVEHGQPLLTCLVRLSSHLCHYCSHYIPEYPCQQISQLLDGQNNIRITELLLFHSSLSLFQSKGYTRRVFDCYCCSYLLTSSLLSFMIQTKSFLRFSSIHSEHINLLLAHYIPRINENEFIFIFDIFPTEITFPTQKVCRKQKYFMVVLGYMQYLPFYFLH